MLLASYKLGEAYGTLHEPGQTVIDFAMEKRVYEWQQFEKPPQDFLLRERFYKDISNYIYLAVMVNFIIMGLDYFIDPDNHFITLLKNKIKTMENTKI
jgi:hypothetical protein